MIRTVYPSAPVIEYWLSDLGTTLLEPLAALRQWAIDHLDDIVLAGRPTMSATKMQGPQF